MNKKLFRLAIRSKLSGVKIVVLNSIAPRGKLYLNISKMVSIVVSMKKKKASYILSRRKQNGPGRLAHRFHTTSSIPVLRAQFANLLALGDL
jgi:hypothetical protein